MLKIAIAQLNVTVCDFEGNIAAMVAAMHQAAAHDADMVVYPELALCAYYPGDMLEDPAFMEQCDAALEGLLQASREQPGMTLVVGTVRRRRGPGKPLHNALLAIRNGQVLAEYFKQLLPTYGVFDERRHFEPGPEGACVLDVSGHRVGFLICEDGWNDGVHDYAVNPFAALQAAGPDVVVSINASPSNIGKREQRHGLFEAASRKYGFPIVYVNQVGGQDQLVFDGGSFAVTPRQGVAFEAGQFVEGVFVVGLEGGAFQLQYRPCSPDVRHERREGFVAGQIVLGLRDYVRRCGFTRVVVGSSGGIDSALTLALAVEALGAGNVIAVTMPSSWSSSGSVTDSQVLCDNLGVTLHTHPIAPLVEKFADGFKAAFAQPLKGVSLENLQARVRGTILMEYSNTFGAMLLTTGNKSEISVGYCTLYGDTNGGLGLIGDLYKTEVYSLSRWINQQAGRTIIPLAVIEKPPSAELAPGQKDSDSLPPYDELDAILQWHIDGEAKPDADPATIARILRMVARNEYKRRQAPPLIRVRPRAFGSGRQMPLAAKHLSGQ